MVETSSIHGLVRRARRRLKLQSALEWATTASILAWAVVAVAIYLVRREYVTDGVGWAMLGGAGGLVALAALAGTLRRFPDRLVATRIDRASGLSDRLASALAFEADPLPADAPEETRELMRAAIADAVRAAPRARVKAATPIRWPADTNAAAAFGVVALALGGLWVDSGKVAIARPCQPGVSHVLGIPDPCYTLAQAQKREAAEKVVFDEDDLDYTKDLLQNLRDAAEREDDPQLREFVARVDELLEKAEKGEISKEQLLEELAKAEKEFNQGSEAEMEEALADLAETGRELKKHKETRELGQAMEKGDLDKAQQAMEELAKKLEADQLTPEQREKIAKAMEKASEAFDKREQQKSKKADDEIARKQKDIDKLKRKLRQEKDESKKEQLSRRLDKKKRELQQLQRKKEEREQSAQRRRLKRLHRNMDKAAENMRQESQEQRRQAARNLRDAGQDTGKVDADRRKIRTQKKVASQLQDLKEAMRRARQRGQRGPKDLFGKNQKRSDLERRSRGGKGSRQAWKPGQGKGQKGQGQGQGQKGQGQQPGGDSYGDQHDPDLLGDATAKSGDTVDQQVQGVHGRGPSRRETILSAAQKGFSSRAYKQVYADYKNVVEEVMRAEKVPSGYSHYVKKYFHSIKPRTGSE